MYNPGCTQLDNSAAKGLHREEDATKRVYFLRKWPLNERQMKEKFWETNFICKKKLNMSPVITVVILIYI